MYKLLALVILISSVTCLDTATVSRMIIVRKQKVSVLTPCVDTTVLYTKEDTIKITTLDTLYDVKTIIRK